MSRFWCFLGIEPRFYFSRDLCCSYVPLDLWSCGPVGLRWACGGLVVGLWWACGGPVVGLWACGRVELWNCVPVGLWACGPVVGLWWACGGPVVGL